MKTKADITIPDKDIDAAIKKEIARLKRKIKSQETKIDYRDQTIRDLRREKTEMERKVRTAHTLAQAIHGLIEMANDIKEDIDRENDCRLGGRIHY